MQEYIWVLCEELDPEDCWDETHLKNFWAFSDFESAKEAMYKLMHHRSCTENRVFDGNGGFRELTKEIQEVLDEELDDESDETCRAILNGLRNLFVEGKGLPDEYPDGFHWSDGMIGFYYDLDADGDYYFSMSGEDDGPQNGVDPRIYINTFHMNNPAKTYVCSIDILYWGMKGYWSVTLKRVQANQFQI